MATVSLHMDEVKDIVPLLSMVLSALLLLLFFF